MSLWRSKWFTALLLLAVLVAGVPQAVLAEGSAGVKAGSLKTFKLNTTRLSISPGKTYQFNLTISPAIIGIETVTWTLESQSFGAEVYSGFNPITRIFTAGMVENEELKLMAKSPEGSVATCYITVQSTPVKSMSFKDGTSSVRVGGQINLSGKLTVSPADAVDRSVTWHSNREDIATVDGDGVVTVHNEGKAQITATSNNQPSINARYTVKGTAVRVSKFTLSKTSYTMEMDETITLNPVYTPSSATYKDIEWTTGNAGVATVSLGGEVKAVGVGSTTIKGMIDKGKRSVKAKITVRPMSMKLNENSITLSPGNTFKFELSVTPVTAVDVDAVTWELESRVPGADLHSSFDKATRTFTAGSAENERLKLTAIAPNGLRDECFITVQSVQVTSVKLSGSSSTVTVGDKLDLSKKLTVAPANAKDMTVSWSSSNENVATVSGGMVTVHNEGTAKITATSNGNQSLSDTYTVKGEAVRVKSFKLDKTSYTLEIGDSVKLNTMLSPSTATYKDIVWNSDDALVASVSGDGTVSANSAGTATITGKTDNGRMSVKAKVTVNKMAITLNKDKLTIMPGASFMFELSITPITAANADAVVWTLENELTGLPISSSFNHQTHVLTAGDVEGERLVLKVVAPNGLRDECAISVQSIQMKSVKFSSSASTIALGDQTNLSNKLTISPSNATNTAITWSSSDVSVATVDQAGLVRTLYEGSAIITATSNANPELSASHTINVEAVRVKTFSVKEENIVFNARDVALIEAAVLPSDASYRSITWESLDPEVATVTGAGVITAVKGGVATIKGTTDNGRKTVEIKAHVRGGDMKTVKLSAVGDVVLGGDKHKVPKADDPIKDGLTSLKRFKKFLTTYGQDYFFAGVKGVFEGDDVTVVNFEGTLTKLKSENPKTYNFSGDASYANILTAASVEVACLANNHSHDFKAQGYKDTVKNLTAADVKSYGFGSGATTTYTTESGVKFGFAGYNMPASTSDISKAIKKLKKTCDVVVVSFHWTSSTEWTNKVSSNERSMSRYAINQGADLVIGHHKHVVSGIERYKGKMIVYDVGNFIALIRNKIGKTFLDKSSMIYQQRFNVFSDGYVEVLDPNIIPVMNSDSQEVLTGNPHLLYDDEAQSVLDKVKKYSLEKDSALVRTIPNY